MAYQDDEQAIPMTAAEVGQWWSRVDLALEARKHHETKWEQLLKAYLPSDDPEAINSNTHFRNTESKKSALWFKDPELLLEPLEPLNDQILGPDGQAYTAADIVTIKQAVLNKLLGRDGVNSKRLMDEVLFDILQVSGLSPTKICYEADFVEVEQPDPAWLPPDEMEIASIRSPRELQKRLTQKTIKVQVPIHEEWNWKRFSPKKLLIPHDWKTTRYDDAPWIGMQFVKPLAIAKREYGLPDDVIANATADTHVFEHGTSKVDGKSAGELVEGVEIWYRGAFFDPKVTHRQLQRRLVLIKGMKEKAAKHTKSPYQSLGPDGRLTPDSMLGYPIHVFTIRDLSDSAYVHSDAAMTDPLVRHENTWASQDIQLRDANIPRFLFDGVLAEALKKLANAAPGEGAEVPAGTLAQGIDKLIAQLPHLEKAMSDVQGRFAIKQLINETLAIGPNQAGSVNNKVLSATEIDTASGSANARGEKEQGRLLDDFLCGVRKFDALVVRFADDMDYVQWVGQDGTKRLSKWNGKMLNLRCAYDAKPDSQLRVDTAQERQSWTQYLNLVAQAPETNRAELLREGARLHGKDPAKLVGPPPPKTPEPPKLNISIKMEDFVLPQGPVTAEIAAQLGLKISPEAIQTAMAAYQQAALLAATAGEGKDPDGSPQTEHGGALESAGDFEPISKHAGAISGQRSGPRTM